MLWKVSEFIDWLKVVSWWVLFDVLIGDCLVTVLVIVRERVLF